MDKTGAKLVLGFIALLIGAILASQAAIQGNTVTDKTIVTDEVVDVGAAIIIAGSEINASENLGPVDNVPTGLLIEDCPLSSITVTNASGTSLTVTTDYTLSTTTGILNLVNSSGVKAAFDGTNNNSLIDYTYCPTTYTNVGWGRTAIDTTMGLYALGVFLIAIGLFYSVWKDSGIMNKN